MDRNLCLQFTSCCISSSSSALWWPLRRPWFFVPFLCHSTILRMGRQTDSLSEEQTFQDKEPWMRLTLRQINQTSLGQSNAKVTWVCSQTSITLSPFMSFYDRLKYIKKTVKIISKVLIHKNSKHFVMIFEYVIYVLFLRTWTSW